MQYRFINDHQQTYPVDGMCECFEPGRSCYYSRNSRATSEHSIEDEALKARIKELYNLAKGRYGHRPIHDHLKDEQLDCGVTAVYA